VQALKLHETSTTLLAEQDYNIFGKYSSL